METEEAKTPDTIKSSHFPIIKFLVICRLDVALFDGALYVYRGYHWSASSNTDRERQTDIAS